MKRSSLSIRLYRRVLFLLAMTALAMGAILYAVAESEVDRASDAQLVNAARLLYMMMQDDLVGPAINAHASASHTASSPPARQPAIADSANGALLSAQERQAFHASYDWCMFAVFWEGHAVAQSGWGAPVSRLPQAAGLHDFEAMGDIWRSYGLPGRDPRLMVVVAERDSMRRFSLAPLVRRLGVPILLLIGMSMVVLWWTLRRSLSEVQRLAAALVARTPADLTPLIPSDWSRDLGPLTRALNKLFVRLDHAYEREQAFTDEVAHELRTPLAAIRAQAQLLRRTIAPDQREDVARLIATADRANALIDGLLMFARLDSTPVLPQSVDVHELISDVVAEKVLDLPPEAIEFTVTPATVVRWRCDPTALQIAVSAVIDNAARHAGAGGIVEIAITRNAERLTVAIADRGPGIPAHDRARLMRRFERGENSTTASGNGPAGSGLGLSIAAKAMTLSGGTIRLEDGPDGCGLLVVLTMPLLPDEGLRD